MFTEALSVVAELHAHGIGIYAENGNLHLFQKYQPASDLEARWEAAKHTIAGLLGWAVPMTFDERDPDSESEYVMPPYVNAEASFPMFWAPRN